MILDDVFPQKELTFPGENAIQDDTMKQRKWKLLPGRLPRMEPQEIFRRKNGSKPAKHEVHFKMLLLGINM